MSREEQSYRATHGEGEDVGHLIWFISPEAQREVLGETQLFLICTPVPCTKACLGELTALELSHQLRGTRLILMSVAGVRNLSPLVTHFKTIN